MSRAKGRRVHPPKVCGTCGRPLDFIRSPQGWEEYAHGNETLGRGETHEPVPVDPTETNVNAVCDFCFAPVPAVGPEVLTVVTKPFMIENIDGTQHEMSSLWAACKTCAPLVEKRRWRALLKRCLGEHLKRQPVPGGLEGVISVVLTNMLTGLYQKIDENLVEVRESRPNELASDEEYFRP